LTEHILARARELQEYRQVDIEVRYEGGNEHLMEADGARLPRGTSSRNEPCCTGRD
jgi:hypothetical protein